MSQQLVITLDDKTAALVKQKPLTKADEIINIASINTYENTRTSNTTTKKKEKLNKEEKDLREQRREQRLLRKLTSPSTQQISNVSENYEKYNILPDSLNEVFSNDEICEDYFKNQESFVNAHQINSISVANDISNLSELNNYFNLAEGLNCNTCDLLKENDELLYTNVQNSTFLNLSKQESDKSANTALNEFDISQCINSPNLYHKSKTSCNTITNDIIGADIVTTSNSKNNTMSKPANKSKLNKTNSVQYNSTKMPNLRIEDIQSSAKCDIDEQELQRASKVCKMFL